MSVTAIGRESVAELLLKEGWIDRGQYDKAMKEYERTRRSLISIFADMGALSEDQRMDVLSRTTHCKVVSLRDVTPRQEVAGFMSRDVCRRRNVVPLQLEEGSVLVAMQDPTDVRTLSDLEKVFERAVRPVLASGQEIMEAIERLPEPAASAAEAEPESTIGYTMIASLTLLLLVFAPLALAYYAFFFTESGKQWYGTFGFTMFEHILVCVVFGGSWAAIAYFINDLIYGKPHK